MKPRIGFAPAKTKQAREKAAQETEDASKSAVAADPTAAAMKDGSASDEATVDSEPTQAEHVEEHDNAEVEDIRHEEFTDQHHDAEEVEEVNRGVEDAQHEVDLVEDDVDTVEHHEEFVAAETEPVDTVNGETLHVEVPKEEDEVDAESTPEAPAAEPVDLGAFEHAQDSDSAAASQTKDPEGELHHADDTATIEENDSEATQLEPVVKSPSTDLEDMVSMLEPGSKRPISIASIPDEAPDIPDED